METALYKIIYENEEKHWWYQGRRTLLKHLMQKIVFSETNSKLRNILDIGCGGGYTLHLLSQFGKIYGIDVESEAVLNCQKRGFENITSVKAADSVPFKSESFDVITCLDVLEHIPNDEKYLEEIYRLLKMGGHAILFVPAFPILWSQLDINGHHYRRYTKKELIKKIKKINFEILRISYFNTFLFPPIFAIRLFQKTVIGKKIEWGSSPVVRSQWANQMLSSIFKMEMKMMQWLNAPFGVSIFAVIKKKPPI